MMFSGLTLDSAVVINVLINILSQKLNNQFFINFEAYSRVHEYASGLTSTSKAELFCNCKR